MKHCSNNLEQFGPLSATERTSLPKQQIYDIYQTLPPYLLVERLLVKYGKIQVLNETLTLTVIIPNLLLKQFNLLKNDFISCNCTAIIAVL